MVLEKYYKKRKFTKTSEPKGKVEKHSLSRFVVQKHQASHLHYDFRLEYEGVLKSWAVPKAVPEHVGIKRLAVAVEDHPAGYINFYGIIPQGEYGAGVVEIWDKGKWQMESGSLEDGSMKFKLIGKKLKGEYVLVRLKNKKNWLIYKTK
ncbi:3'-phosphoesterase [Patescibacteria group bacterium]|nr:3'-phosphoesterase [Patescibacteria group bacterium]MBU1663740.1 3'-phosphoesterase [Patescibacteria group bacterium]MBU1934292.1 3'-phosphoesterase [Patescibacteria group bacterium]MBU2007717.1 3'-phosphoesterase [Patescibacteria group bacterium]MBU2233533.1 3'-phosphoesterase [Patescibacteria group bacterium]